MWARQWNSKYFPSCIVDFVARVWLWEDSPDLHCSNMLTVWPVNLAVHLSIFFRMLDIEQDAKHSCVLIRTLYVHSWEQSPHIRNKQFLSCGGCLYMMVFDKLTENYLHLAPKKTSVSLIFSVYSNRVTYLHYKEVLRLRNVLHCIKTHYD